MKALLFCFVSLLFNLNLHAQYGTYWAWHVDTTITYTDLKYSQDKIYGVGYSIDNGILAQKDTNGNSLWMQQIPGAKFINLDVTSQGDLVAIGQFSDSVIVNGITYLSAGDTDVLIVRCNVSGVITLVKTFGSTSNDYPIDICADADNRLYFITNCGAPVSQSGNTFSGFLVSKIDSNGNPIFLHQFRAAATDPSMFFELVSIKYNPTFNKILFSGDLKTSSFDAGSIGKCIYDKGTDSILVTCYAGWGGRDIFIGEISANFSTINIYTVTLGTAKTHFTSDLAVNKLGNIVYTKRFQYTLSGYTNNFWSCYNCGISLNFSSDGHHSPTICGEYYKYGRPLKLEADSLDFYGSIYQPELYCSSPNCSVYYLLNYQLSSQTFNVENVPFEPKGVCGHLGNFYVGSYHGLYKTCNNGCSQTALTINPAADVHVCPGSSGKIGRIPCSYVGGGTKPYTFSWQPTTGLNNPNISNPTVSGLSVGVYIYTLTVTDANNNIAYDTVMVQVVTPPVVSITYSPNPPVCGIPLTVYCSGASTYDLWWNSASNIGNHINTTDSVVLNINYSTNFMVYAVSPFGCSSYSNFPVVFSSYSDTTYKSICSHQLPYLWNGQLYSSSGIYYASYTNAQGCDSTEILNLYVYPTEHTNDSAKICENQLPYNWNGNILYSEGVYVDTFTNVSPPNGCDSIVSFKLMVEKIIDSVTASPSSLCGQGTSTLQLHHTVNYCIPTCANGSQCIASFQFNTINNITGGTCSTYASFPQTTTVTAGNNYSVSIGTVYNNNRKVWIDFNQDGDFTDLGELVFSKDTLVSVVTGVINIPLTAYSGVTKLRVGGTFNGTSTPCYINYYGEYEDYNITIVGGQNLTPAIWSPPNNLNTTIGNSVNATITNTSTYTVTATSANGCSQTSSITIQVNPNSSSTQSTTVCSNQLPYTWNGQNLSASGVYTYTTTNAIGCDSLVTLNFTVNSSSTTTEIIAVCSNQLPYSWNGQSLTSSGTYTFLTSNANGCDSLVTLNFTVNNSSTTSESIAICSNQLPYSWNGQNLSSNGTYTFLTSNANGCDSLVTLNFTVNNSSATNETITVCSNQLPYIWNGQNLTTSGTYNYLTTTVMGCDSLVNLNFMVNATDSNFSTLNLCANQVPYSWNGNIITNSGLYTFTSLNMYGCDSLEELQVLVYPLPIPIIQWNGTYLSTTQSFSTYQWYLNGGIIVGATNSTYTPLQNGNYLVYVTDANGCSDSSSNYVYTAVAIENISNHAGYNILPNPANQSVWVLFEKPYDGSIRLMNAIGQLIQEVHVTQCQKTLLDISQCANGIYTVQISKEGVSRYSTLLINREE